MMEPGMMLFSNMLVGAVQFRTVRVQPDDCSKFHADKISESRNLSSINHFLGGGSAGGAGGGVCYPDFYEMRTGVATDAYGERTPGVPCSDNSSATCRYTHSWHNSSLKGSTAFARSTGMTENFGKGGYTVELPRDRAGAVATLAQLEQDFLGRENGIFFEFSLCLSRTCLGKMFVFIYKWRKNAVFRRPTDADAGGFVQRLQRQR
jgi:hypothetical protein